MLRRMFKKADKEPPDFVKKAWPIEDHFIPNADDALGRSTAGVADNTKSKTTDGWDNDNRLLSEAIIQPPDGGWGWVVVASAFASNLIDGACVFNAGYIFLPSWIDYFNTTSSSASWVLAIMSSWYFLGGPFGSAIANTFGFRVVGFIGATLACSGFLISVFAPSLSFLCFSYGFLIGTGFGFLFMPTVLIISFYFKKRRALALGIAAGGTGFGQLVFAPVLELLHSYYSWQEMCVLMAGISMQCYVCVTLYRPLNPTADQIKNVENVMASCGEKKVETITTAFDTGSVIQATASLSRASSISSASSVFRSRSPSIATSAGQTTSSSIAGRRKSITVPDSNFVKRTISVDLEFDSENLIDRRTLRKLSQGSIATINQPLNRMDIFSPNLSRQNTIGTRYKPRLTPCECSKEQQTTEVIESEGILMTLWSSLKQMLDLKLFMSPTFLVWVFSGSLMSFGFFVPFTYLPMFAILIGHSSQNASLLVSIIGVVNTAARVLVGLIADRPNVDAIVVQNVSILLGGVATLLLPHFTSYWQLVIYSVFFGTACACYTSLRSIVCIELMGLNNLTTATGWIFLFLGVANLVGSPTVSRIIQNYANCFELH
ncbi:unnamed protein product [Soboliphyme baturini]|uniref:MFS domain-containing protein n=1 Tax=Soboliphyme baturini TaxID=241478 RepID=A0A183IEC6_9BILA|nr:unnamed protein product [Soboliphyme baturini]